MPVHRNRVVLIVSRLLMWGDTVARDEILKRRPVCLAAEEEASLAPRPGMGVRGGHCDVSSGRDSQLGPD